MGRSSSSSRGLPPNKQHQTSHQHKAHNNEQPNCLTALIGGTANLREQNRCPRNKQSYPAQKRWSPTPGSFENAWRFVTGNPPLYEQRDGYENQAQAHRTMPHLKQHTGPINPRTVATPLLRDNRRLVWHSNMPTPAAPVALCRSPPLNPFPAWRPRYRGAASRPTAPARAGRLG